MGRIRIIAVTRTATWSHHVYIRTGVGVIRVYIRVAGGANSQHMIVSCRVIGGVTIVIRVACRCYQQSSFAVGIVYRVFQCRGAGSASQAQVDDLGAVIGRPGNAVRHIAERAAAS